MTTDIKDDFLLDAHFYVARALARGDRLEQLHAPIEIAIKRCSEEIERAHATVDELERFWADEVVDRECDEIEEFLGVAFGATQVVLTAFRTRFVRLAVFCKDHRGVSLGFDAVNGGHDLFGIQYAPELRRGCGFTAIQAIYEVANYWKHKDEWTVDQKQGKVSTVSIWLAQGKLKPRTVNTVMSLGMQPFATGNLRTAVEMLGVKRYDDLRPIRSKVERWMQELLSMAEQKLGVRPSD